MRTAAQLLVNAEDRRMELLALDRGAGMARRRRPAWPTAIRPAGTPGTGLGAVRRLAQTFEVVSWPGHGTAVFAEIRLNGATGLAPMIGPAGVAVAMPGEVVCGDGWTSRTDAGGVTLLVVDGLGHGTEAAVAANAAVTQFHSSSTESPADILAAVHRAMRHTRGGAVAVARIEWASETVTFAGLGNIAGTIVGLTGEPRRMVSYNGIAGHNARKIQSFEYPCPDGVLIMHSDGIGTSWAMERLSGARQRASDADRRRALSRQQPRARRRNHRGRPHETDVSRTLASMPVASAGDVVTARLNVRRAGRVARVRPPGADARRDGRVGDRTQRRSHGRRAEVAFQLDAAVNPKLFTIVVSDKGPGHRRSRVDSQRRKAFPAGRGSGSAERTSAGRRFDIDVVSRPAPWFACPTHPAGRGRAA